MGRMCSKEAISENVSLENGSVALEISNNNLDRQFSWRNLCVGKELDTLA